MKLTIERAALLKALGHVQSAVERRNTIPILSNVLLSAEGDRLSFSATDLDLEIIDEALAQVDQPGQITAPAHTLYEIVRKLPEGADVSLSFTGEDPRLTVQAGRSRFNLPVLPAGDFPVMSAEGLSARIGVDVNELIRLIDKTRFAISTEETRCFISSWLRSIRSDCQMLIAVTTSSRAIRPSPIRLLKNPFVMRASKSQVSAGVEHRALRVDRSGGSWVSGSSAWGGAHG